MNQSLDSTTLKLEQIINNSYKYGFSTKIQNEEFPKGINEDIVTLISKKKRT